MPVHHSFRNGIWIESEFIPWPDGVKFFTKRWIPKSLPSPRALVIFLHGFAEHVERYDHVWPLFAARGIEVFGYDQRGFGKTGPEYGDTTLEQQVVDLEYAIRQERKRLDDRGDANVPLYLYGHSLGGGVILSLLTRQRSKRDTTRPLEDILSGVICGAPWILRPSHRAPSNTLLWIIWAFAWLVANAPIKKELNPNHLTSDPERAEAIRSDPLFRGDIRVKAVSGLLLEGYRVLDKGYKNWPHSLPILISHGEKDESTSCEASRTFIEKISAKDKEFKSWPDMLHEGHNERKELREPFLEYSIRWLEART